MSSFSITKNNRNIHINQFAITSYEQQVLRIGRWSNYRRKKSLKIPKE